VNTLMKFRLPQSVGNSYFGGELLATQEIILSMELVS
jgi:hypothetical protein